MREVSVNILTPNSYFSEPVYLDEKYILLTPDTPVTDNLIKRLQEWRIEFFCSWHSNYKLSPIALNITNILYLSFYCVCSMWSPCMNLRNWWWSWYIWTNPSSICIISPVNIIPNDSALRVSCWKCEIINYSWFTSCWTFYIWLIWWTIWILYPGPSIITWRISNWLRFSIPILLSFLYWNLSFNL